VSKGHWTVWTGLDVSGERAGTTELLLLLWNEEITVFNCVEDHCSALDRTDPADLGEAQPPNLGR